MTKTWADDFSELSYFNSTGTEDWLGDWVAVEQGVLISPPNDGGVRIGITQPPQTVAHMSMMPFASGDPYVTLERYADLSAISGAELCVDVDAIGSGFTDNDRWSIQLSQDGGKRWTTIKEFKGAITPATETIPIPANFIGSQFGIRFFLYSGYAGKMVVARNLEIKEV